jgi:hypothetical protein
VHPRDDHAIRAGVDGALSIVHQLPPRLQRMAMLRALGLTYADISQVTGDSPTRVAQLVARANLEIHEIRRERAHHERESSPRAERLWELEHRQLDWLVGKLGRLPRTTRRTQSQATRQRAWRRAALALDDLRNCVRPERFDVALATTPREPVARRLHELAHRALDELQHARTRERGRRIGD